MTVTKVTKEQPRLSVEDFKDRKVIDCYRTYTGKLVMVFSGGIGLMVADDGSAYAHDPKETAEWHGNWLKETAQ
jgi:hypothetical protein